MTPPSYGSDTRGKDQHISKKTPRESRSRPEARPSPVAAAESLDVETTTSTVQRSEWVRRRVHAQVVEGPVEANEPRLQVGLGARLFSVDERSEIDKIVISGCRYRQTGKRGRRGRARWFD